MRKYLLLPAISSIALLLLLGAFTIQQNVAPYHDTQEALKGLRIPFTILKANQTAKGTILVLPGFNFSRTKMATEFNLCKAATAAGYNVVIPEMLKSIYASQYFPETRKDWLGYPQLHWVLDTLLPFLQKKEQCFLPGQNNFIVGFSTGARGVAIIAEQTDTLFKACVGLSGDYNPLDEPRDNLITGYYGPYEQFKQRWTNTDHPQQNAAAMHIPSYLVHGAADKVVAPTHSVNFYNALKKTKPALNHQLLLVPNAGHDTTFWNNATKSVLLFIQQHTRPN